MCRLMARKINVVVSGGGESGDIRRKFITPGVANDDIRTYGHTRRRFYIINEQRESKEKVV